MRTFENTFPLLLAMDYKSETKTQTRNKKGTAKCDLLFFKKNNNKIKKKNEELHFSGASLRNVGDDKYPITMQNIVIQNRRMKFKKNERCCFFLRT